MRGFVAVVVAVAVTVAVAVFVGVGVAVAAAVVAGAVEDYGHMLVFLFFVEAVELGQHRALEQTGADNEDGPVNELVDNLGVGDNLDGRAVDDDIVVAGAHAVDKLAEARRFEQFGGVRRNGADREHMERRHVFGRTDKGRCIVGFAAEIVGKAGFTPGDV